MNQIEIHLCFNFYGFPKIDTETTKWLGNFSPDGLVWSFYFHIYRSFASTISIDILINIETSFRCLKSGGSVNCFTSVNRELISSALLYSDIYRSVGKNFNANIISKRTNTNFQLPTTWFYVIYGLHYLRKPLFVN